MLCEKEVDVVSMDRVEPAVNQIGPEAMELSENALTDNSITEVLSKMDGKPKGKCKREVKPKPKNESQEERRRSCKWK